MGVSAIRRKVNQRHVCGNERNDFPEPYTRSRGDRHHRSDTKVKVLNGALIRVRWISLFTLAITLIEHLNKMTVKPKTPPVGAAPPASFIIDQNSDVPLHAQVRELLRELIREPEYQNGALLPD